VVVLRKEGVIEHITIGVTGKAVTDAALADEAAAFAVSGH
jgi:hypothetical protein